MTASSPTPNQQEHLRSQCIQALKDELSVEKQLEALQAQLKSLRHRGTKLQRAVNKNHEIAATAFERYAKASCRDLCASVYKKFHREIRDIIYSHIVGYEDVTVTEPEREMGHDWRKVQYFTSTSQTHLRWGEINILDHWWDAEYMGSEMLREIGEQYYTYSRFLFRCDFHLLSKFRVTDQWKLGFLPVEFVADVEFSFKCSTYSFDVVEDHDGITGGPDSPAAIRDAWNSVPTRDENGWVLAEEPKKSKADLLSDLESLFGFKAGTALHVKMFMDRPGEMWGYESQQWMCENVVSFIFPTLRRLVDAGYRVRLILVQNWRCKTPIPFMSNFKTASVEDVTKSFYEYVAVQDKLFDERCMLDYSDEDFEDSDEDVVI